jgi:hypothetical protein
MATKQNIATPNLLGAPRQYDPRYQELLNNTLRLFFNKIVNQINSPVPYGAFYNTDTLTNPTPDAMNLVPLDSPLGGGYQTAPGRVSSRVYVAETGIYNVQFSAQANVTAGGGTDVITLWLRINDENLPASSGRVIVNGPGAATMAAWNYVIQLVAGDYIELAWTSPESHMVLQADPGTDVYPAIPSVILTITWVSLLNISTGLS